MMWVSEASRSASVAGWLRQVVSTVSTQCPVSPGQAGSPSETPCFTYSVLYSFSSSGQFDAL